MTAFELLTQLMKRPLPQLSAGMRLDTIPGFDSLVMVNLVLTLESRVGRELTEHELEHLLTIADVDTLLEVPSR